jgi:hypothetical protein
MSSVMHPVGPEPEQIYWRRRLAVIVAAVLLVALVIALVVGGTSTGSAVSAVPSPSPVSLPTTVALTPTPVPSASVTPTLTPTPTTSETDAAPASPSASPSPSGSASTSTQSRKSATPTPSAKPTKAAPVACSPKDLRATLTGKPKLKPKQATTFALSLINGSDTTCVVTVDRASFELKIYSGTDRIWSSKDCSTAVKTRSTRLKAEDAVQWSMRWDGRRSRKDCKVRPEIPRPGTYFATAQLDGAKPVQLRLILRG